MTFDWSKDFLPSFPVELPGNNFSLPEEVNIYCYNVAKTVPYNIFPQPLFIKDLPEFKIYIQVNIDSFESRATQINFTLKLTPYA